MKAGKIRLLFLPILQKWVKRMVIFCMGTKVRERSWISKFFNMVLPPCNLLCSPVVALFLGKKTKKGAFYEKSRRKWTIFSSGFKPNFFLKR